MVDGQSWKVVGGVDKGGIVVRTGKDVTSSLAPERLSTGALVRELELDGERLRYERLTGRGPTSGWVSIKLTDGKELLVRARDEMETLQQPPPVVGRKLRIVALHASASNSNILKFQTTRLRQVLGKGVEWLMPDGQEPWAKPGGGPAGPLWDYFLRERTDFEKRLAKDKPFCSWVALEEVDGTLDAILESYDGACTWIEEYFAREGPIDAVVAFSQSTALMDRLSAKLRRQGKAIPWRINISFSASGPGRHDREMLTEPPMPTPTVLVTSPQDEFSGGVKETYPKLYSNLLILEHSDGHAFPITDPCAGEVYKQVADFVWKYCGHPVV